MIQSWLLNIRFYILVFSIFLSFLIYVWITNTIPAGSLQTIKLTQTYALTAIAYLYLTLLAGPLCYIVRIPPFRDRYLKARRALGVSVFYFALLHANFAFFGELGGFNGLPFLKTNYLLAISFSFVALIILFVMSSTAFDYIIYKLSYKKWKILHRFVYLAGVLILIHALMLGSDFSTLYKPIPRIIFGALFFLFVLEANRFDAFLQRKFINLPQFGISLITFLMISVVSIFLFFIPNTSPLSLSIHTQHLQLAKQIQTDQNNALPNIPSLQGDRTKRFTVSFIKPEKIEPDQDIQLSFEVFDASSGNKIDLFRQVYTKPMHLIIVNSTLTYFNHIHPVQTDKNFSITTQFPKPGLYHLYINFQPFGAIEQQFEVTVNVGNNEQQIFASQKPDTNLTKTFGKYEITLDYPKPLLASKVSVGEQLLTFTIRNADTKEPITNLKPYLASFGHLTMVNKDSFEYLHVHPTNLTPPAPDQNGGPSVEFMPLGLYGSIKSGIYRVFAEFNPENKLILTDFTIKVE